MAHNGLGIFILIIILLLDQSQPAKLKARKHSKRRVKEKDGDLKTQVEKLWREVNALKEMQALQSVCLRGVKVDKKCYLASDISKYFHEANEDCISKGGTLVVPRNSDETNALREYGKKSLPGINDFWLGINDLVNEGKFVDVNGVAITFLNWDRAEPNGGKRENCALFSQATQGKWSDESCRSSKKYICEFIIP